METYELFYTILKNKYNFVPKFITCDFMKSNINAIYNIFKDNTKIITCFFHYVQCLWRKANSFHLRNKNYIENTKVLIFNLKILPFLEYENMFKFYKEIKIQSIFNDIMYDNFFNYLEKNWIGYEKKTKKNIKYVKPKYPFELWGYCNIIEVLVKALIVILNH